MKIGLLSDAHGNPSGLKNCLSFLERQNVEQIFFLGDAIGYLPRWAAVLELLQTANVFCLRGNHDARLFNGGALNDLSDAYQILPEYVQSILTYQPWIETWPSWHSFSVGGKKLLFVHGSPFNHMEGYVYPWSSKKDFSTIDADVIFMGHTHRPFIELFEEKILVNVGSCGLPRDHGALSSCAVYDTVDAVCEIFRVPFDIDEVIAASPNIHHSVELCLRRTSDDFVGKLIP
mgnify:CR=1 FL=1